MTVLESLAMNRVTRPEAAARAAGLTPRVVKLEGATEATIRRVPRVHRPSSAVSQRLSGNTTLSLHFVKGRKRLRVLASVKWVNNLFSSSSQKSCWL